MTLFVNVRDLVELAVLLVFLVALVCANVPHWWRRARCRHDQGVNESMACDAICRGCGKNLGFIGTWRATQRGSDV